ncbi:POTRA domain-containing protein [Flavobacteriaceae bacterium LMO-SS05]
MLQKLFGSTCMFCLFISTNLVSQSLYLKVEGGSEHETKIIDSITYKNQFQDYSSLNAEIIELKKQFENLGYLESESIGVKKENDSIYLAQFLLKNRYKSIHIYYGDLIDKKTLSFVSETITDTYFEINFEKLEETLNYLNSRLIENGNPFSSLKIQNIKKQKDFTLIGELTTSNREQRTIDTIIVKGYEKFPKPYIKHYLKLKPKQVLSLKKITEKTSDLDNLPFANQIKEPELLFTKDSTALYIYVEKTKSNAFDGFLGFGTNDQTQNIEFNGYLNLNLVNNLNYGESLKLYYKSDENKQRTFDIKTNLPYLLGSPLGTEFRLNIFKKDSSFVTVAQSAKLIYQLDSKNSVSLGIHSETSNNLLDTSLTLIQDYKSYFYFANYLYVKTQRFDRLFPVNLLFDVTLGSGTRTIDQETENQTSFNIETYKIFNLNTKNSIYTRFTSSFLTSTRYLDNELLRFGGIHSIRGFEENSLLANFYTVLNTEYRYRLSNTLFVHSILDAAYFENKNTLTKQKLFGFGFGFGLLTNAGLFKFNYSGGKIENQMFKLSDSKIHISLTTTF